MARRAMKLSVLMPVYNERATLGEILRRVQAVPLDKEIIVVDNCSTDGTREDLRVMLARGEAGEAASDHPLRVVLQEQNRGKGASVRRALDLARGEWVVVQDADLEYDPRDIIKMLAAAERAAERASKRLKAKSARLHDKSRNSGPRRSVRRWNVRRRSAGAVAVFGTRLAAQKRDGTQPCQAAQRQRGLFLYGRIGLSVVFRVLYGVPLSDVATCYKLMPRETARALELRGSGFDLDFEIAARLARRGVRILEVPISYQPRSRHEGKKIRAVRDGWRAVWTLLRFRFAA